jgi:hypothetical protein
MLRQLVWKMLRYSLDTGPQRVCVCAEEKSHCLWLEQDSCRNSDLTVSVHSTTAVAALAFIITSVPCLIQQSHYTEANSRSA